ncbi:MAG: ATP-grasp domain-containing protein [Gammaproteobacteria bacterium]|nr:ATP-grasp domain-containing protein [Gammaproteobacteria bacterium]
MDKNALGDLYLIAENLAQDSSLVPEAEKEFDPPLRGVLTEAEVLRQADVLDNMDIDSYIEAVVANAEDPKRIPAPDVIRRLGDVVSEDRDGPFYAAEVTMDFDGEPRRIGFIAQNRAVRSGEWMPEHHLKAAHAIVEFANRSIPIVSLMDTPGAAGDEVANKNNQSHSISRLIAEMSNTDVPNLGVVYGLGYSGGAIPLAASNLILSLRDGVFSTIQPKGLASIARRLNLSWQQCAKQVGLSPYELRRQGNIDAIVDYVPGEDIENLRLAIVSGIQHVEEGIKRFVRENPYVLDEYRRSIGRYLDPSERLRKVQASAALKLTKNPTEYLNVFGIAYRYLRYLRVRRRIKATSTQSYGRLSEQELPAGELAARTDRERRETFLRWLQDPDRVIYDDSLSRAWKNYVDRKQTVHDERGRIMQFIFGERRQNYEDARRTLISTVGMYLYNRWKNDASGNFRSLKSFAENVSETRHLFRVSELNEPRELINAIREDEVLGPALRQRFTHEGMKLFGDVADKSDAFLREQIAAELNMAITEGPLAESALGGSLSSQARNAVNGEASTIVANRLILDDRLGTGMERLETEGSEPVLSDMTVVDVVLHEELRDDYAQECENLLLFDQVYDHLIANLESIAEEAESTRALSKSSLSRLIETALAEAAKSLSEDDAAAQRFTTQFFDWYMRTSKMPRSNRFFRDVEEWKKNASPHVSDTLFVVVTFMFEKLLASYLQSEREGRRYDGRIAPRNIGRRKDFWNRLIQAYRDLLIRETLQRYKRAKVTGYGAFIERFFSEFEELNGDLISSDPHRFPGLRVSIEGALQKGTAPCGVVTGIGRFDNRSEGLRVGTVISNLEFKAGAFDMASAEKFCKLMVACAEQSLPIVCFISSSGMQTMEGAGALFSMAAINDRITRFVRDYDLPVIVFGFGDCTGGAQASFVTHPLVQTYYFSGASMPFAGQIVVSSYLPSDSHLSNYLFNEPGSMQGLVQHPFLPQLDDELRKIDPEIPVPQETVEDVVNRIMAGVLTQEKPAVTPRRQFSEGELFRPVRKMLVHARGCTAVKLVRVAQKHGVGVVLVQSDPDMESVPVDMLGAKDAVVCIGGNTPDESYLNARSVVRIAEDERVDSLHPGIGFLSENAQFAELVRSRGINFVGPPVASMETMGNKSNAIATALDHGVPVVPGSHGILTDGDRAAETAASIGYPVLIKAVHGGGGKGIQVVETADDFHEAFHRVSVEARAAFGNGDVYLERYVTSLRHIEVQVLRDSHGTTKVLGLRDCSVQRDKQKVIEESGSTMLPGEQGDAVRRHAAALADAVGYVGAGTVEFIYDLDSGEVYFMEMNTRLQVEHPVTEWVSGVDIVGEQLRIAAGESIEDLAIGDDGYAIEARINAEKVVESSTGELLFAPSPGAITECEFPQEDGIDIIAAAGEGRFVSPYYDSMIAQIIARGPDRTSVARKLADYLDRVRIRGIATNVVLVKRVLRDEVFQRGDYDTGYLPELLGRVDARELMAEIADAAGAADGAIGRESIAIEDSDELKVLAPSTGILYLTPSPSEPQYVVVGDRVSTAATLCQLEAFKIFAPVHLGDFNSPDQPPLYEPDRQFEITRVNVSGGQQVNAGDLLFVVRPVI